MGLMSIGSALSYLAAQAPDALSIVHEDGAVVHRVTRREVDLRSNRLARAYEALGVKQGDFVTIALPNSIEFYLACLAAWKLGATPQPVSAKLPASERRAILELAKPSLIVGGPAEGVAGIAELPAGYEPSSELSDEPLPDRVAPSWKAPTSGGSTGRPKVIVATHPGVFDPDSDSSRLVQLVPGPLYHNAPFVFSMRSFFTGAAIVLMTRFDAEHALALIDRYKVQDVVLVPTMMHRIMRLPREARLRYDVSSLFRIFHMAAPCPPWLKEAFIEWLGPERVWELYAGTESQAFTIITGSEWLAHRGSVGKAQGGTQIKILDSEGRDVPPGVVGEVFMRPPRGPGSTYRYIGATAKAFGEWESLGDMGQLDAEGYLYLADRQTDMVISGGANIYPAEVESALDAHPLVRSSAAIGLPDDDLGQKLHAIVDIADSDLTLDALLETLRPHLEERLVRYKIPRTFELVHEPLRDDAGKVRRSALRAARIGEAS
jgi:bile acid-coenzyme A ligase